MQGTLVRGGVDDLGADVVVGPRQRLGERRVLLDELQHLGREGAVPVEQVLDADLVHVEAPCGAAARRFHAAGYPSAPRSGMSSVVDSGILPSMAATASSMASLPITR